jgi:hypothetical protein
MIPVKRFRADHSGTLFRSDHSGRIIPGGLFRPESFRMAEFEKQRKCGQHWAVRMAKNSTAKSTAGRGDR